MPNTLNTNASLEGKTITVNENADTITGLKTFDRDPSAPFAVSSGSAVVSNLDADKLDGLNAAEWASYTPTLTNLTIGDGTVVGRYRRMGTHVEFSVTITLGSTSSVSADPRFTAPVQMSSIYAVSSFPVGQGVLLDTGVVAYPCVIAPISDTTCRFLAHATGGSYITLTSPSSTVPFTWGTGDVFYARGTYEATAAL